MANPPRGGDLHKVRTAEGLGKSTLINPSVSIPMPPGVAPPRPPATSNQGQGRKGLGSTGKNAQGSGNNG